MSELAQGAILKRSAKRVWAGLGVALALCFSVSALGGLLTASSVENWYLTLEKPAWTPPGWVFGPVWFLLYTLMAVAAWEVWRSSDQAGRALGLFGAQLALNLGWSASFFGLRRPGLALLDIALLLIFIVATMIAFWRIRRRAAWLLAPYLLWTSFAAVLNAAIWWENRLV